MPPVRWKIFYVTTMTLVQLLPITAGQLMQDSISMSSDGWRPIIGSRGQLHQLESKIKTPEITHYRNPSQIVEVDIIKADTPVASSTTAAPKKVPNKVREPTADTVNNNIDVGAFAKQGGKIPPHSKFTSPGPYQTIPTNVHGPVIPIGSSHSRPGQFGQKRPQNKPTASHFGQLKRKPVRVQATAYSNREEVFVRPPSSASFSVMKPGHSNIKTRETQGLGIPGINHFSINQPNSHLEFTNRFAIPQSSDNYQQFKSHPVTTLIFTKPPTQSNDIRYQFKSQNDDYTRNLVPPPLIRFEQDKEKYKTTQVSNSENVIGVTEPFIKAIQFGDFSSNVQQFNFKPPKPQENLAPQLPPQFDQNFSFQKQFTKPNEQAIDVQVTKEKFKVFHDGNVPTNFNPNVPDYIDYDFHSVKRPSDLPKLQTYEVTEGKWADNPNPYTFNYPESQQILPQRLIRLPTARPQLAESMVELRLPPFLPTPYKPQGVVPTSPTQSEASTVFSKVSTKMNRFKNEALTTNPLFFDVKEVSTHYPILGIPGPMDSSTNNLMPLNEISNEITTMKQAFEEVEPTTIRTPQRTKTRRRKPQPRKPTTTTTTEEPPPTASYELQKTQESYEEMPIETERPLRRPRPRPNRYRASSGSESEERPTRYRTTTPASENEDSTEKRVRGKHRYRQRGNGSKSEIRNSPVRKRVRPPVTEMPSNHKTNDNDMSVMSNEATDSITEQSHSIERETQGIFETKYPLESFQSTEELTTKLSRLEYELPERHHEPTQYEQESKYETTIVSNEVNSVQKPSIIGADEPTEKTNVYDRTRPSVGSTTLQDTTANIHLPENEIDYSTTVPALEQNEEHIETTLATTLPTTTTTETPTTTKSHRIRGRPTKYDLSSRPRFSVKDYRQRLNQYTSTTPSTTTDFVKTTDGIRLRFPSRLRTRPTPKTTTIQPSNQIEEEQTEPIIRRGGFKPKEPRHSITTTESPQDNVITEKNVKSVNTRVRPFGRFRSTTESSSGTTSRISIKPNLFSARKRPAQPSLRNRVYGKLNKNATEETTTYGNDEKVTETSSASTTDVEDPVETTTHFHPRMRFAETTTETSESTTSEVNEDDYSQRVSELTSSFKNEYETPGLFKSVSPTSRRIPSYFTISTDDPILPIEAFFPNIKDKDKDQ